jgi:hypothetical protein
LRCPFLISWVRTLSAITCACGWEFAGYSRFSRSQEHLDAFLIGNECGLGDHHFLFRLPAFDFDANELSIDERAGRIRESGAHKYRVGVTIDLDIDEVDAGFLLVCRAVGKPKARFNILLMSTCRPAACARKNSLWLTGKLTYMGSWLTMTVRWPLSGLTTLPLVMLVRPTFQVIGATISV